MVVDNLDPAEFAFKEFNKIRHNEPEPANKYSKFRAYVSGTIIGAAMGMAVALYYGEAVKLWHFSIMERVNSAIYSENKKPTYYKIVELEERIEHLERRSEQLEKQMERR